MTQDSAGTYTFLFTDIEGSTPLWEEHPKEMAAALERHDRIMRDVIAVHQGRVFKTIGDAFCAVFPTPIEATRSAAEAQRRLAAETWATPRPLRVRMAVHSGPAEARDDDFFGPTLNRVARLLGIGHGGQVLLSQAASGWVATLDVEGYGMVDLGRHQLKGLAQPEAVSQLTGPGLETEFAPLASEGAAKRRSNLPEPPSAFVGRLTERAEIGRLLGDSRLVTLCGAGGCGKTRLALQVAREALDRFADGAAFADLAAISDPSLVAATIASAMGLKEKPGEPVQNTLLAATADLEALIVVDNCEHLIGECARLAASLLSSAPRLRILATSREPLGTAGESTYRVPSMAVPPDSKSLTLADIVGYESVELFLTRATAVAPDFKATDANAPAIAAVCRRLDGIPFAIELAGARTRSMSAEQINTRLDDCFRLLTGGDRTALPRQQTLRALIDWSYGLLNDQEKGLLARLSVFAAGWSLAAAERVTSDDEIDEFDVLDLMTSLVDKSLVSVGHEGGQARYRLLSTVHRYAQDRLEETGTAGAFQQRHLDWALSVAEAASTDLETARMPEALATFDLEEDNLRAALDVWESRETGVPEHLRAVAAMGKFWLIRGRLREGRDRVQAALARPAGEGSEAELVRAWALQALGNLIRAQGDLDESIRVCEEAYEIRVAHGDVPGAAECLNSIGVASWLLGESTRARELFERSLASLAPLGEKRQRASSLNNLGILARDSGDYEQSQAYYAESIALRRELEDLRGLAASLNNLGNVVFQLGDLDRAGELQEEALAIFRRLGDATFVTQTLDNLGMLRAAQLRYDRARDLHLESLVLARELGAKRLIAQALDNLGLVGVLTGDLDAARDWLDEALDTRRLMGDSAGMGSTLLHTGLLHRARGDHAEARRWIQDALRVEVRHQRRHPVYEALEFLATVVAAEGESVVAAQLVGAAEAGRGRIGSGREPLGESEHGPLMARLAADLGSGALERHVAEGKAMSEEEAVGLALGEGAVSIAVT